MVKNTADSAARGMQGEPMCRKSLWGFSAGDVAYGEKVLGIQTGTESKGPVRYESEEKE